MSYSFRFTAATKAAAKAMAADSLDKIIVSQPAHARDKAAALANANAVIDLVADDSARDVNVSMNGTVATSGDDDAPITGVSVTCYAALVDRPAA